MASATTATNRCPAITTAAGVLDRHAECELPAGHGGPFDAWDAGEAVFQALEDLPIAQRVMAAVFAAHSHVLRGPLSDRQGGDVQ